MIVIILLVAKFIAKKIKPTNTNNADRFFTYC